MPDIVIRWLSGLAIVAGLCGVSFMKGCEHERDKWETLSAKAQAEAEAETARRLRAQTDLVAKHEKERNDAKLSLDRANQSVRSLRDAIGSMSRDTSPAGQSQAVTALGDELGACGERIIRHAQEADEAYSRGKLCEAIYSSLHNSIRSRK